MYTYSCIVAIQHVDSSDDYQSKIVKGSNIHKQKVDRCR